MKEARGKGREAFTTERMKISQQIEQILRCFGALGFRVVGVPDSPTCWG